MGLDACRCVVASQRGLRYEWRMEWPQDQGWNRNGDGTWRSGISGNPGGRPKGSVSLAARLRRRLAEHPEEAEAIIDRALLGAKSGDPQLLRIVLDRHDGPVAQKVEGLSEEDIIERLSSLLATLMQRMPDRSEEIAAVAREHLVDEAG